MAGMAAQLQVATAGLAADQRDELDAPRLELDTLEAGQASARGMLEATLNSGERLKKKPQRTDL